MTVIYFVLLDRISQNGLKHTVSDCVNHFWIALQIVYKRAFRTTVLVNPTGPSSLDRPLPFFLFSSRADILSACNIQQQQYDHQLKDNAPECEHWVSSRSFCEICLSLLSDHHGPYRTHYDIGIIADPPLHNNTQPQEAVNPRQLLISTSKESIDTREDSAREKTSSIHSQSQFPESVCRVVRSSGPTRKQFICSAPKSCGKVFLSAKDLKRHHRALMHNPSPDAAYLCACGYATTHRSNHIRHISKCAPVNNGTYRCDKGHNSATLEEHITHLSYSECCRNRKGRPRTKR